MKRQQDLTQMTVENQVLKARSRVQKELSYFWERKVKDDFDRFQRRLIDFYQLVRVYVNNENHQDLVDDLDQELKSGKESQDYNLNQDKVDKWIGYYFDLEQVLFEEGITDISQSISSGIMKRS